MKKNKLTPGIKSYCEFLKSSISEIDAMIFHIESVPFSDLTKDEEREIRFDSVPFLKKIKEAKRSAEESISFYGEPSD